MDKELNRFLFLATILILTLHHANAQSRDQAAQFFEIGENQLNGGQYKEAIQSFSKVIALQVDYADAYYYRGVAREKTNDIDGAIIDYSITLEWKSDFAEALFRRAAVHFKNERYDAAELDFARLLTIPQGETHDILYRQSSYDEGINRIITTQGATDIIYNYLGVIAIKKERYVKAITLLDSAINLYNGDADYYVNRGLAYEKLQRYEDARADYEMAIQKSPDHGLAHQHLSSLARIQGNLDESNQYLSEAIERNPSLPYAYLERAFHRSEAGNYVGAIEDYTAALKIDSADAEVWVNRGLAFEKINKLNAAYWDFTRAIKYNEALENAWLCRANILVKQNKLVAAIEDYGVAILYAPGYALAYYNRALIRYRMGEKSLACDDLAKAESLNQPIQQNVKRKICESETY